MRREFTGRDMAKILVAGFGVVVAVNFGMATIAAKSFSGTVVDNSYIASQKFNGWLDEAKRSEELGWTAEITRDEAGYLIVTTEGAPPAANVSAALRRPIGEGARSDLQFAMIAPGQYRSAEAIEEGRWIIRLAIESGELRWSREDRLN